MISHLAGLIDNKTKCSLKEVLNSHDSHFRVGLKSNGHSSKISPR